MIFIISMCPGPILLFLNRHFEKAQTVQSSVVFHKAAFLSKPDNLSLACPIGRVGNTLLMERERVWFK